MPGRDAAACGGNARSGRRGVWRQCRVGPPRRVPAKPRQDAAAAFAVPEDVEDEVDEADEVDEEVEVDVDESLDGVDDDSGFLAGESPLVLGFSALVSPERESL